MLLAYIIQMNKSKGRFMKDASKTGKSTVFFNLFGLLMIILTCVFITLSFSKLMIAVNEGYLEEDEVIWILLYGQIAIICLTLSVLSFSAEIYKSLSNLEKEVYGKRKN